MHKSRESILKRLEEIRHEMYILDCRQSILSTSQEAEDNNKRELLSKEQRELEIDLAKL